MPESDVPDTAAVEIEVHVLLDADGNYVASEDSDKLMERYGEEVGDPIPPMRTFKLVLTVPRPTTLELRGTVEAEPGINHVQLKVV